MKGFSRVIVGRSLSRGDSISQIRHRPVEAHQTRDIVLAGHILDRKAGHFDPGEFKDEYELALRKLVKRKAAGRCVRTARGRA